MGCIGVRASMRSLDHRKRSEVATESINRLCEASTIDKRPDRNCAESISDILDDKPNLLYAGTEVELAVTNSHLNLISCETQETIVQHEMPNVSFASVGDEETVDFVAYVAKDDKFKRACFVLKCGHEAKNVFQGIACAFQSRTELIKSEQGTRDALKMELWFHGSNLSREESELRLINDGDFLVRECTNNKNHFVLSVMHDGEKLHLFFDTIGQAVVTKDDTYNNISHLVKNHHETRSPIIAKDRTVYLLNGVQRPSETHDGSP